MRTASLPSLRSWQARRDSVPRDITHCPAWSELVESDRHMRLVLLLALLLSAPRSLLSGAQDTNQLPAGKPNADSFQVVSVSPSPGTQLHGNQAEFRARVRYSLDSMEQAILMVFAERFRNTPQGCSSPAGHQNEGSSSSLVKRGTGEVEVTLTWYGSTGPRSIVPSASRHFAIPSCRRPRTRISPRRQSRNRSLPN